MHKFSLMSLAFFHHGFDLSTRCAYPRASLVDTAAGPPIFAVYRLLFLAKRGTTVGSELVSVRKSGDGGAAKREREREQRISEHQTPIKHGEACTQGWDGMGRASFDGAKDAGTGGTQAARGSRVFSFISAWPACGCTVLSPGGSRSPRAEECREKLGRRASGRCARLYVRWKDAERCMLANV